MSQFNPINQSVAKPWEDGMEEDGQFLVARGFDLPGGGHYRVTQSENRPVCKNGEQDCFSNNKTAKRKQLDNMQNMIEKLYNGQCGLVYDSSPFQSKSSHHKNKPKQDTSPDARFEY